jgi:hypothetical protein
MGIIGDLLMSWLGHVTVD